MTLVAPVACYGFEVFAWHQSGATEFKKVQFQGWKKLMRTSGRAPHDSTDSILSLTCCTIEWRVRRAGHFVRLLNQPVESLQQAALFTFWFLQEPWFVEALADLQLVMPSARVIPAECSEGPFLHCNGWWADEGWWMGLQSPRLPLDMLGRRYAASTKSKLEQR